MNNEQFRRLLFDNPASSKTDNSSSSAAKSENGQRPNRAPALGARMRMTPRAVPKGEFTHQFRDQSHRDSQGEPLTKKLKSSTGPKGYKLAAGYEDRALLRQQGTVDEAGKESGKSTNSVKGLDWELLRRVKAGDDSAASQTILEEGLRAEDATVEHGDGPTETQKRGNDDEFERIMDEKEKIEKPTVELKEKQKKKGNLAPLMQAAGGRLTRDEILKQLKASRAAGRAEAIEQEEDSQAEPVLGTKFKKIGSKTAGKKKWIETDANGRRKEILLITDSEGRTKRKARWLDKPNGQVATDLLPVDKDATPLGMEVPADILAKAKAAEKEEEDDDDIFAGIGADYNPLADLSEKEDDSASDDEDTKPRDVQNGKERNSDAPGEENSAPVPRRDYFSTGRDKAAKAKTDARTNPLASDPTILEALKRAAAIKTQDDGSDGEISDVDKTMSSKQRAFLEEARRRDREDAMDMDMGFGGSRFDDDDDDEKGVWEERGGSKRKRGPKKRKGDEDSVNDVMNVLEGRRTGKSTSGK